MVDGAYDSDNLRFRRAYIRERLLDLKTERARLVAEREQIEIHLKMDQSDRGPGKASFKDRRL